MIRSCNVAICYRLLIYSNFVIRSNALDENGFCILTVAEMICFLLVLTRQNIRPTIFFDNKKSYKNGSGVGSGPERVSC